MDLFGAVHRWKVVCARRPPFLKSAYNEKSWNSYTLPKKDPKTYINQVTNPLNFAEISMFSLGISNFCYIKKFRWRLHFNIWFLIFFNVIESLKVVLINIVAILIKLEKLAPLGLLKRNIFLNKGYDVIIFLYDVTNKTWLKWHGRFVHATKVW